MKNIIVVLALVFTVAINAQTKEVKKTETVNTEKLTPEMAAKKNVMLVNNVIVIDKKTQNSLQQILISKYDVLNNNKNLSPERRSALSESISSQIEAVLGKDAFAKIKRDPTLYKTLVN